MYSKIIFFLIILLFVKVYNDKKYRVKEGFFKEIPYHPHLDIRYGKKDPKCNCKTLCFGCGMDKKDIHKTLIYLLKKLMDYSDKRGIKPILMYGNLIGYYFNGKMLPWDDDIDMILLKQSADKLENYEGEDFLIEVNPNGINYSEKDWKNKISARVISKTNGIFIDLTFYIEKGDYYVCKDGNKFLKSDVLPINGEEGLKKGFFEGVEVWLPNNIENCLRKRYGENVFTPLETEGFKFNKETKEWSEVKIVEENQICKRCYRNPCNCLN
tara:strand:- start:5 stop:811 length:807 start_codon:yes stop_codon:yes gene_type:complete